MGTLKELHRIYFGFDGKPDLYREYLETWKERLPEYKIMHWNAENLPMDLNEYVTVHTKEKDAVFLGIIFVGGYCASMARSIWMLILK